jgi:hypothetical protein
MNQFLRSFPLGIRVAVSAVVASAALLVTSAMPAAAYGNGAAYQVGLSLNCQNPVTCVASPNNPFGIGGIWGWIVIDKARNVDGELEFQGHQNADPSLNGAGHISLSGFAMPTKVHLPFIPADPNGNYLLIFQCGSGGCQPVFEIEATGGHYAQNFGPGINSELQVSQLP